MALPGLPGGSWLAQQAQELWLSMERTQPDSAWLLLSAKLSPCLFLFAGGQLWLQLWPDSGAQSRIYGKAQTLAAQYGVNTAHSARPAFRFTEKLCLCDELFARLSVPLRKESVCGLQNCHLSTLLIENILYSLMVKIPVPQELQ